MLKKLNFKKMEVQQYGKKVKFTINEVKFSRNEVKFFGNEVKFFWK